MLVGLRAARNHPRLPLFPPLSLSAVRLRLTSSAASPKDCSQSNKECEEFLPWLRRKAGSEISSVLEVGFSIHGRSLFASKSVRAGDNILKVPYSVQITSDNLLSEIEPLLVKNVGNISQLAVILLAEQKFGQDSEWAPYINSLPRIDEMHNTIFWSAQELDMIRASPLYQDTLDQKAYIEKEFRLSRPILECFPHIFGDYKLEDFMHAYSLVGSRAWGMSKGVSLIPFADFLNHDGISEAVLLSDDDKDISEAEASVHIEKFVWFKFFQVIADRDYAIGEEVFINYGKFSNATLLLDFGFTVPYNIHDQVKISMVLPLDDPLYKDKVELLRSHRLLTITDDVNDFNSMESSFILKEVKSASGKGKGIPQALRAFARVLSATSPEELKGMATEAVENDGRLARRSLRTKDHEIQAHRILLSRIRHLIEAHDAAIKGLGSLNSLNDTSRGALRKRMASCLLAGELRVLTSAAAWLANYCALL